TAVVEFFFARQAARGAVGIFWNPLFFAAHIGGCEKGQLFLGRGAKINDKSGDRRSPVFFAARFGHKAMVELLLRHGVDINIRDAYDESALTEAVKHGELGVARLLAAKGAKLDFFTAVGLADIKALEGFLKADPALANGEAD